MPQIGELYRKDDGWHGYIQTSRINLPRFHVTPNKNPQGDNPPDYVVNTDGNQGKHGNLGTARAKVSDQGTRYMALVLDDPDWSETLFCSAFFTSNTEDHMQIVWQRPRRPAGRPVGVGYFDGDQGAGDPGAQPDQGR